mmetsp:Transcript_37431/g.73172  ORF Transcript_37431/g.73172 Transcript_37431/m.73172 type:complete len:260 (+) Transcript_37431:318-1097(+)
MRTAPTTASRRPSGVRRKWSSAARKTSTTVWRSFTLSSAKSRASSTRARCPARPGRGGPRAPTRLGRPAPRAFLATSDCRARGVLGVCLAWMDPLVMLGGMLWAAWVRRGSLAGVVFPGLWGRGGPRALRGRLARMVRKGTRGCRGQRVRRECARSALRVRLGGLGRRDLTVLMALQAPRVPQDRPASPVSGVCAVPTASTASRVLWAPPAPRGRSVWREPRARMDRLGSPAWLVCREWRAGWVPLGLLAPAALPGIRV